MLSTSVALVFKVHNNNRNEFCEWTEENKKAPLGAFNVR